MKQKLILILLIFFCCRSCRGGFCFCDRRCKVKEIQVVPSDSRLNLQAYGKPGKTTMGEWLDTRSRKPFTAKWTDDVNATLTVQKPSAPRGSLDWWEITSATITYPKVHPDFSWGDPVPPQEKVTKTMTLPGRGTESEKKATITFEEDWALDGFNSNSDAPGIYNMRKDEVMTAYPKDYPITVNYKVTYQYTYEVCGIDYCWDVTKTKSYTDTVTANLLVNGAGQVLYGS